MALSLLSASFQSLPLLPTIKLGPSSADFLGGWVCVHSRTLWVSSTNSPVRLGVSPTAASTPTGVFSQRLEALFPPHWNSGFRGLSCSPVVPPGLSASKCGTAWSPAATLLQLLPAPAAHLPPPTVWMNVYFLTSWLSYFHAVRFSGSSGCFLLLNLLLCFFWLGEEAQCVYLCLHLGQKSALCVYSYASTRLF